MTNCPNNQSDPIQDTCKGFKNPDQSLRKKNSKCERFPLHITKKRIANCN